MISPKVLVVNQPFNKNTGGGITLSNLFAGWALDKLAVVCPGDILASDVNTKVCDTYYQIGDKERKLIFPFNFLKRKYYSGLVKFEKKEEGNLSLPKSKLRVKIIMDYIYPFIEYIGLLECISKTSLSKELCEWLDEYKPEVVYAQAASRQDVLFCLALISYLKKPVIFHMMDDWPSTIGAKGLFGSYWHKKIDLEFRMLLNQSDLLMSISDYMAAEYLKRYNKQFITFHNPINIQFWESYRKTDFELSENPTVLYAGRIGLGIDSSLQLIAKAIEKVNEDLKIAIKFVVQAQDKPSWIRKFTNVIYSSFVLYKDLPKVFAKADFLIIPYDFSKESMNFIKFSMPTKAPEYMASGTPIVIFAPKDTAIVDYAEKNKCAKIVTENNIIDLASAFEELIQNKSIRKEFSENASAMVENNHNSTLITHNFRALIYGLTQNKSKNIDKI